jgi:hypothetical protein
MARRVPLETDLGDIRPHTKEVFEEFAARYEIYFAWGIGASGDHEAGKALDLMAYSRGGGPSNPGPIRTGWNKTVAEYAWAHHRRLGIDYVIYDQLIQSNNPDGYAYGGWHDYTGESHANHVHISFEEKPPAYRPPGPSPYIRFPGAAHFRIGRTSNTIGRLNMRLAATGHDAPKTREFTAASKSAYAHYQRSLGYTGEDADGIPGETSWTRLRVRKNGPLPPGSTAELEDAPMAGLPAQQVQVEGESAIFAVTFSGAVHIKNATHLDFLVAQGWVTEDRKTISKAQLAALREDE